MKRVLVFLLLGILSLSIPRTYGWVIPPNPAGEDNKYELYGPHVQGIIIKVYANATTEWNAMGNGSLDLEDWTLDPAWTTTFGAAGGPWTEQNYGGEAGYFLFDINNNATMAETDAGPFLPNPTSDFFMREALAYAANRSDIVSLDSTSTPIYTPVPAYMTGWINHEISPDGSLSELTYGGYTGNGTIANIILDAHYFPVDNGTGWRYWDRNANGVKDAGEDMKLIFYSRDGLRGDYADAYNNVLNTVLHINTDYHSHVSRDNVTNPVFAQEYFNIYTGGWINIGPDPLYLFDLYSGSNFYHPGSPANYDGINYAETNESAAAILLAPNTEVALNATLDFQYWFAHHAAAVPLWSYSGVKAYKNVPVDPNVATTGNWTSLVNQNGVGVNSWWSTLDMRSLSSLYPNGSAWYGFSSAVMTLNILYASWFWDSEVLCRIYDAGAVRDPYTLGSWVPQLFKSWSIGNWTVPYWNETVTDVTITLRPDVCWQDGQPVTMEDVYYTFVGVSQDLLSKGLPPPSWYSIVSYIGNFRVIDDYNMEIQLGIQSAWAAGWILGNLIIPKHIWKPIVDASSPANPIVQGATPDPNIIGSGPFKWYSGLGANVDGTIVLVANFPGAQDQYHNTTSPGYYLRNPVYVDVNPDNALTKITVRSTDTSIQSNVTLTLRNLWLGGNLTGNEYVYVNGVLLAGFPLSKTLAPVTPWNLTYPYPADPAGAADVETLHLNLSTQRIQNSINVAFKIAGPDTLPGGEANPWLNTWTNVTLPLEIVHGSENHPGNSMWIEPSNILLTMTNPLYKVGYRFNATVYINITSGAGVFAYQIAIHYNRSQLKAVAGGLTGVPATKSEFFETHSNVTSSGPVFDTSELGNGSILVYEGLQGADFQSAPRVASLWWFTFEVVEEPHLNGFFKSTIDISTETNARNWVTDPSLSHNLLQKSGAYNCDYTFTGTGEFAPGKMWVSPSTLFATNDQMVGDKFNVTVSLSMAEDIYAWETVLDYNRTQLRCTRAGLTSYPISQYMVGHITTISAMSIDSEGFGNGTLAVFECCLGDDFVSGPHSGSLFWAEFQILQTPGIDETLNSKFDISTEYFLGNTWVLDPSLNELVFSPSDAIYDFVGPIVIPTPTGSNVTLAPTQNLNITFANVTTEGFTTVTSVQPPTGQSIAFACDQITTNATYEGNITFQFAYNAELSPKDLQAAKVWFWNESSASWLDMTTNVNATSHTVTCVSSHLSMFGVTCAVGISGDLDFPGTTTVSVPNAPPAPPNSLAALNYYQINTTKNLPTPINISLAYDYRNVPPGQEIFTQMWLWNESSASWVDITTGVNTTSHIVYGSTPHLSMFGVTCLPPSPYDVATFGANLSKTVVCQGYSVNVSFGVLNNGTSQTEFDVPLFWNTTVLTTYHLDHLNPNTNVTLSYTWNTDASWAKGNYSISTYFSHVGWVIVTGVGDISMDGKVDGRDLIILSRAFGSYGPNYYYPGSLATLGWNPNADITNDNKVDGRDLLIASRHFGEGM
jgi:ABC-type transport system substrate-binding protein